MKSNIIYRVFISWLLPIFLLCLSGCKAKDSDPGVVYAPEMYYSQAYEPLKQITDSTYFDYNSNPYNKYRINMREPAPNTIRRGVELPYHIPADSLDIAARVLKNPMDSTEAVLAQGEVLYGRYCQHCHGEKGQGDGLVGAVLKGVPSYSTGRVKTVSEGHIFHVITYGKGRMGSHRSQITPEERWKIVRYVQTLQNQQ